MNKWLIIILIVLLATSAMALRIARPPVLTHPLTEDQVTQLNKYLEDVWHMQYGRYEMDIVTTPKNNANNGEMWLVNTTPTAYIQFKVNNHVYTLTPQGF